MARKRSILRTLLLFSLWLIIDSLDQLRTC